MEEEDEEQIKELLELETLDLNSYFYNILINMFDLARCSLEYQTLFITLS